jgi:hypothetical protein
MDSSAQSALARSGVQPPLDAVHDLTQWTGDMALVLAPQELCELLDGSPIISYARPLIERELW